MSTSVTLNAVSYSIPAVGESNWGTSVSSYLVALSTGVLQKAGGTFTLTADVDFGATYGLKSAYYKSRGTVSSAGVMRLANAESVGWRNAANGADKLLKVNSSDVLEFDGNPITAIALGAASTVLRMNAGGTATEYAKLVDANIASAAAIAVNKLAALTASRATVTDGSGFLASATTTATEIGYVTGVTSAIQTQIDSKQLRSTLTTKGDLYAATASDTVARLGVGANDTVLTAASGQTTGHIWQQVSNAMIVAAAAISVNKLAALTASRAVASDSSGFLVAATTTATELNYVNGVTSAIQTQLDAKQLRSTLTAKGDIYAATASNAVDRLGVGADGSVLTAASGQATGLQWTAPLTNPMDSAGDLIVGGTSGAATKLDSGATQTWLVSAGAAAPTWTNTVTTGKVIDGSVDENQLRLQGHSSQTSDILVVEKSDGTDLLAVTNSAVVVGNSAATIGLTLKNSTTSYSPSTLNYYEEYTSTVTLTLGDGGSDVSGGAGVVKFFIRRIGKLVMMTLGRDSTMDSVGSGAIASASVFSTPTGTIPARFLPGFSTGYAGIFICPGTSSGTVGYVYLEVHTTGRFRIANSSDAAFTNGSAAAMQPTTVSWPLD